MTREDARTFTRHALAHIGVHDVVISPTVTAGSYRSSDPAFRDKPDLDIWRTDSDVAGGHVQLLVPKKGNSAVFVRDSTPDGRLLLSQAQVRSLSRYRFDPVADRRRHDHLPWALVALVLVLGAAAALAPVARRGLRR